MFETEYVDPDKSKCPECGCSFGVHRITCPHFHERTAGALMPLPFTTCVINLNNSAWVTAATRMGRYLYIGRPGQGFRGEWGNDWSHIPSAHAKYHVATLGASLREFEDWFIGSPLFDRIEELRGKVLGCFCASLNRYLTDDRPICCHGQVYCKYLKLLNPLSP